MNIFQITGPVSFHLIGGWGEYKVNSTNHKLPYRILCVKLGISVGQPSVCFGDSKLFAPPILESDENFLTHFRIYEPPQEQEYYSDESQDITRTKGLR